MIWSGVCRLFDSKHSKFVKLSTLFFLIPFMRWNVRQTDRQTIYNNYDDDDGANAIYCICRWKCFECGKSESQNWILGWAPQLFLEMSGNQQSSSLFTSQPISTVFIQYTLIFAAVAALAIRAASCAHNQHHKNE